MIVRLDPWEVDLAALVGVRRQAAGCRLGLAEAQGYVGPGWDINVLGAAAELAVAKAYGRYWDGYVGPPRRGTGDVAGWEVRHTLAVDGHLILHPGDRPEAAYILVTGRPPDLTIRGFAVGSDVMVDAYRNHPLARRPGDWWVPQGALRRVDR